LLYSYKNRAVTGLTVLIIKLLENGYVCQAHTADKMPTQFCVILINTSKLFKMVQWLITITGTGTAMI